MVSLVGRLLRRCAMGSGIQQLERPRNVSACVPIRCGPRPCARRLKHQMDVSHQQLSVSVRNLERRSGVLSWIRLRRLAWAKRLWAAIQGRAQSGYSFIGRLAVPGNEPPRSEQAHHDCGMGDRRISAYHGPTQRYPQTGMDQTRSGPVSHSLSADQSSALLARALAKRRRLLQQSPREFFCGIASSVSLGSRPSRLARQFDSARNSKNVKLLRRGRLGELALFFCSRSQTKSPLGGVLKVKTVKRSWSPSPAMRIGGTAFVKLRPDCFCSPVNGCNQRPTRKTLFRKLSSSFGVASTTLITAGCSTRRFVLSRSILSVVTRGGHDVRRPFLLKPSQSLSPTLNWKMTRSRRSQRQWNLCRAISGRYWS